MELETPKRRERSRRPWSRVLIAAAVGGPALAIGGVHPEVVPVFGMVVLLLWLRITGRAKEPLRVPWVALVGAVLAAFTLLQWLPMPGVRGLAPGIDVMIDEALAGSGVAPRSGLSASPSDTLLEVSRLAMLVLLTIAAAQVSWRVTVTFIAVTGTLVAAIGLAHGVLGMHAIYGLYEPEQVDRAGLPALMGTFVNANHQSGLLLLGIFCAAALAVDQRHLGLTTRDVSKSEVYRDRLLAALGAVAIQIPALVLSLSRGALVAFAIVAPIALVIALRRSRSERKADPRRGQPTGVRLLIVGGLVVLVAVVAQHGAWRELATLWSEGITDDRKVVMFEQAPALIALSPVLGIGRGAFIDLYPSVEARPSYVQVTHLESAPMAMVVEWGPVVGGLALVAFACWFVQALWYGGHKNDARPRRVVLLGLLALAIHQSADFALEFLGVAAPACALAGALSPAKWIDWQPARARIVGVVTMVAAIGVAILAVPGTWSHRGERDDDLRARPLDATLHAKLARTLLADGDVEGALQRATAATKLQPGAMEGWLLRSDAAARLHHTDEADDAMRRALVQIHVPPSEALVDYLASRYPDPARLGAVAPSEPLPWRLLVRALEVRAPDHADAVARLRAELDPSDPEPLVYRSRIALARGNAALSLHHARLLQQAAPELAASHLSIAGALAALGGREAEIVDVLEAALADDTIADPAERGRVEEHLVRVLLSRGDDASLARARELVPDLVARPASRDVRRRRRELAKALAPD